MIEQQGQLPSVQPSIQDAPDGSPAYLPSYSDQPQPTNVTGNLTLPSLGPDHPTIETVGHVDSYGQWRQ